MRVLRAFFYVAATLIFGAVLTPGASASPQQATAPPSTPKSVAAPSAESGKSGWDPDLVRKARPQQAPPVFTGPYAPGEVFVSDGTGLVDVYKPDGTLLGALNTTQLLSAGMAFDQTGDLFVTTFGGLEGTPPVGVVEFDINGNFVGPFGDFPTSADGVAFPESILFNKAGNAFVGAATEENVCPSGSVNAFEFGPTGSFLNMFTVTGQCRGTDWVELLPDQQTLLYTSEGTSVLSFNISTNTQNADLADNLPGEFAYAFRVLPNGNLLVADSTAVVQLSPSGQQVMTYTPNPAVDVLFALNLDPDGTSFWTADLATGTIFRFTIADGTQLVSFVTPSGEASGLAVFGEKLVGTNNLMVTDAGSGTGTVTSAPSGISCPSSCLAPFSDNSSVTLTAAAAAGSTFAGFSANCVPVVPQTNPPSCAVPIVTSDVTVTATFNVVTSVTLSVTKAGTGTGTVTSSPVGINCGATCSASFTSGAVVVLTAFPADGSNFAGWSGAGCTGTGTCSVTMSAAEAVTATFNTTGTNFTLTVNKAGTGTGTVTSSPAGINCGATCSASFTSGQVVVLTATAATGSTFAGWSGAGCTGTSTCSVTMSAAEAVTATFNTSVTSFTLSVTKAGTGTGTVTSSPAGINCGATCSASFASGTVITLTATPSTGSTFTGWGAGPCEGTGTCTFTISAATTVVADFTQSTNNFTLTVNEAGTGTGTVSSAPAGINCPTTCSASFASGAVVALTAAAAEGSTFAGWSGAGCTGTGGCSVTITAAQTVTATFTSGNSPVTIGLAPGSPSTVNTTPGSSAVFGLTLTALPGTTGTVTLGCTSTSPNITCNIVPSTITLTGKAINVAIVVNTFCKGFVPNFEPTLPGGFGGGMALLLASMSLCGAMWTFKRRPRWALSFAMLMIIVLGNSACSSLPKSPGGTATKPGLYPLVVTATAPNGAVSSVNLTLNVLP
jgi:Divergent InlB B-repeat domain